MTSINEKVYAPGVVRRFNTFAVEWSPRTVFVEILMQPKYPSIVAPH